MPAQVLIKQDAEKLMIGAEITGGEHANVSGSDLVDIWRDDSFEVHILTSDKKRYQFILNSRGAMYDATVDRSDGVYDQSRLNASWNSGAVHAAKKENGKWSLEPCRSEEEHRSAHAGALPSISARHVTVKKPRTQYGE